MEEVLRRLVLQDAQPSLSDVLSGGSRGPGTGYAQYGLSPRSGRPAGSSPRPPPEASSLPP